MFDTRSITPIKIFSLLVFMVLLSMLWGSWYTIDTRQRGLILTNGRISGEADPGLHFKTPFIDSVVEISTESHRVEYLNMELYSKDQQPAKMAVSVLYHVLPSRIGEVYSRFTSSKGIEDRIIQPKVFEQSKNVFGQFDAVTAVQERTKLNAEIAKAVHNAIAGMGVPAEIESVQIENVEFSPEYMKSIEQRMQASVEVDRIKQNALREKVTAEITVTRANAEAEATIARAKAESDAIKLRGDAEASAIKARAEALGANPNLVTLTQAEKWDGKLPSTMVPNSGVPFLRINP